MNDTVLDVVLVGKHVDADALAEESTEDLVQSKEVAYFRAVWHKLVRLVVGVFHQVHSIGNFWAEHEVKSESARELYEPHGE